MTGILCVARKYKNESYLSTSINLSNDDSEEQQEHNVTKVKVPYFFTVSIRDKIGEHTSGKNKGKPIYATKDIISKEPFPKEWDITKTKPVEITFQNECPKCEKEGRPRVNKKNNGDFTHYNKPNSREEYRLAYWHKVEGKKDKPCIIARFDKEHGIFTKTGKISKKIENYIFPNYLIKDRYI